MSGLTPVRGRGREKEGREEDWRGRNGVREEEVMKRG
jgi:hypothetical protein